MSGRQVSPTPSSLDAYLQRYEPPAYSSHQFYSDHQLSASAKAYSSQRPQRTAPAESSSPKLQRHNADLPTSRREALFYDLDFDKVEAVPKQARHMRPLSRLAATPTWREEGARPSSAHPAAGRLSQHSTSTSDEWQALKDKYTSSLATPAHIAQPQPGHVQEQHLASSCQPLQHPGPTSARPLASHAHLINQQHLRGRPMEQVHTNSNPPPYNTHSQVHTHTRSVKSTPRATTPTQVPAYPWTQAPAHRQQPQHSNPHMQAHPTMSHVRQGHQSLYHPAPISSADPHGAQSQLVSSLWQQAPHRINPPPHVLQLQAPSHPSELRASPHLVSVSTQTTADLYDIAPVVCRDDGPSQLAGLLQQLADLVSQLQAVQASQPGASSPPLSLSSSAPAARRDREPLLQLQSAPSLAPEKHSSSNPAQKMLLTGRDSQKENPTNPLSSRVHSLPQASGQRSMRAHPQPAPQKPAHAPAATEALHSWPGLPDSLVTSLQSYLSDKISRQRRSHPSKGRKVRSNVRKEIERQENCMECQMVVFCIWSASNVARWDVGMSDDPGR